MGRLGQPITLCGRPNQTSHGSCSPTPICGIWFRPAFVTTPGLAGIFGEVSNSCLLTEPEPGTTRVVRRMRLRCGPWLFRVYVVPIVLVWGEEITARNFLRGVKRRAESGHAVPSG